MLYHLSYGTNLARKCSKLLCSIRDFCAELGWILDLNTSYGATRKTHDIIAYGYNVIRIRFDEKYIYLDEISQLFNAKKPEFVIGDYSSV